MQRVRQSDIKSQSKIPTSRHEKWHTEFPGKNPPPKNLQSASIERQRTTDEHIKHNAQTLHKQTWTQSNYSNQPRSENKRPCRHFTLDMYVAIATKPVLQLQIHPIVYN